MLSRNRILSWTLGIAVAALMLLIALYPQIELRQTRDVDYAHVYAYNDLDETAYAAYLQSQIDNRPRRSNPYTGVDDAPGAPQRESLFSIQFFAPSLVAFAARAFNADASTAMIWAGALAAFCAALALFRLVWQLADNALFAAATTLLVLCAGVLAIGEGAIGEMIRGSAAYPYFPFLRRYVPAVGFPFFWVFCAAVWQLLTNANRARRAFYIFLAAACFAALVYSYFYLWTTAAAFLVSIALLWLAFRPENWRRDFCSIAILFGLAILSLAPYALLLADRDRSMDAVQLLLETRLPDLLRAPEALSCATLALLCYGVWRQKFEPNEKPILFAAALALVPFAVFNQQIVTGRALQPIHYEVFIVNYVALLAFCLALFFVARAGEKRLPKFANAALSAIALLAAAWGAVEAVYTTAVVSRANFLRDEAALVNRRLREIAATELFDETNKRRTVFALNLLQGDDQPTFAPQAVLWARHGHVFAGESFAENRSRFYHYLHFANFDEILLERNLRSGEVVTVIALFGWDRLTGRLSNRARPLTEVEIVAEAENYKNFRRDFNRAEAARHKLSYFVADNKDADLTVIDRWYERDGGENIGSYKLYRLKLRE